MIDRRLRLLALSILLFVLVSNAERARNDDLQDEESSIAENEQENDDDVLQAFKRFLTRKKTTTPKPSSDALAALVTTTVRSRPITTTTSSVFGGLFGKKSSSTSRYGGLSSTSRYDSVRSTTPSLKEACGTNNPCKNGATCRTLSSGQFYCFCTKDYYGKTCENKFHTAGLSSKDPSGKDHCASSPCRNAGDCISLRTTYYCRCKTPFYGISCDKRLSKREELVDDESNSADEELTALERDLTEDNDDLRQAIASEHMLENIQ